MWQHPNPYLINIVAIWMVVEVLNQEFAYATKRATREVALCCGERGIRARPEGTLSQSGATERT